MESIYWFGLAYLVGTVFGLYVGSRYGIGKGILVTLETLVEGGYVKTRTNEDGEMDLLKLTLEDKLNATPDATSKTD
mgnify:CR=1 FL=1|jgi:hypothetical protein|tara:strand:+ start:283 stop:513 length:231 start_codon:yes stop_codon:yes gene_type:complete